MQRILAASCLVLWPTAASAQGPVVPIPNAAGNYRAQGTPTLVAVTDGVIHLGSYTHPSWNGNELRYARSTDVGRTWSGAMLYPADTAVSLRYELVASATHLHALLSSPSGVRCRSSSDAGLTWQPALPVPSIAPGGSLPGFLVTAAEGATLVVLSGQAYGGQLSFSRSLDGGATWLAPFVPLASEILTSQVYLDSSRFHVVSADTRTGDVFHQLSSDTGRTWSPRVALTPQRSPGSFSFRWAFHPAGNDLFFAYDDSGAIWVKRSTDGGASWPGSPVQIAPGNTLHHVHSGGSDFLAINLNGGAITVLDSLDHGATWTPRPTPLSGLPTLAADGNALALVAEDYLNATTSMPITAAISSNRGQSWSSTRTISAPIGNPPPYYTSWHYRFGVHFRYPTFVLHEEDVSCANFGGTCYWLSMQLLASTDGGSSWFRPPLPAATFAPGSIELAPVRDSLYLLVGNDDIHDPTSTPWPIYGAILYGSQPYGSATAGSAGIAPELNTTGAPLLGRTLAVSIDRTLGGAPALLGISLAGEASLPLGAGSLWIQPPITPIGGVASGPNGTPGVGSLSFSQVLPSIPSLRGARLNFQGFVLDAGAQGGFALTAGLEVWLQ